MRRMRDIKHWAKRREGPTESLGSEAGSKGETADVAWPCRAVSRFIDRPGCGALRVLAGCAMIALRVGLRAMIPCEDEQSLVVMLLRAGPVRGVRLRRCHVGAWQLGTAAGADGAEGLRCSRGDLGISRAS